MSPVLAIIAIASLSSVVIVQQITIQRISGHTAYVTQRQFITLMMTITTTQQPPTVQTNAYVWVGYGGKVMTFGTFVPSKGDVFSAVVFVIGNHGYDRVYVLPPAT
jgi:hypothetical protein